MLEVTRLPAHTDRRVEIERKLVLLHRRTPFTVITIGRAPRFGLDEAIETGDVFEFGVGIEQECGMVRVGHAQGVELLQVGYKVVNPLCVEELHRTNIHNVSLVFRHFISQTVRGIRKEITYLPHDITRLHPSNCLQILLHRTVIITLPVQTVTELPMDIRDTRFVEPLCLGHVQCDEELRFAVEEGEAFGCGFFLEADELRKRPAYKNKLVYMAIRGREGSEKHTLPSFGKI